MSKLLHTDHEFQKLLARRDDVDLTVAALEVARDADPSLDFDSCLNWIRARGRELLPTVARLTDTGEIVHELANSLARQHSLSGHTDCYGHAESSYLNHVVESKRGLPISLALVYMAVAKEIGLELHGVSCPAHFLVRAETENGPLFIDCFASGRVLTEPAAHSFIAGLINDDPDQFRHSFQPARPRTIIIRVLNNLKCLFADQQKWSSAYDVQNRLSKLQPSSYRERRDLALISLRANRHGVALNLLHSLLKTCPAEDREVLKQSQREAERGTAIWN